ncbi:protein lifeguard 2-like [Haematobia irritans]|uniref:Putative n-methyl-d-aspartate receptor glutamate-binding subunit n=2 Tax=Haematobia irritans TaxID=7368 RepID=A0A1L8EE80_HAEIR
MGQPNIYEQPAEVPPSQDQSYGWKNGSGVNSPSGSGSFLDPETLLPKNFSFNEESVRKGFVRKVYLILMGQLLFTFGVVSLFLFHKPTLEFSQNNPGLVLAAAITTLIVVISMACCESARRSFPANFICLGIFTFAESFLVGAIAGRYNSEEVFIAIGITAILCLALTIFAMQTKYDFTVCGGMLLAAMICLLLFGIVAMFWRTYIVRTIYAGVGALLACMFLIYDTQIMMGGEHKYSISPEEYIFAALNLYMDVVRIFIYVLQLIGNRK